MPEELQPESGGLRLARFSISDALKVCAALLFVLLAWARVEAAITSINARLDHIEINEQGYVRTDLSQSRNETIQAKLDELKTRTERIEMKLDYLQK